MIQTIIHYDTYILTKLWQLLLKEVYHFLILNLLLTNIEILC